MIKTLEQKLELIKDVKKFCEEELGVIKNNSYTKINESVYSRKKSTKTNYNLCVSPKNSIEPLLYTTNLPEILEQVGIGGFELKDNGILKYSSLSDCILAAESLSKLNLDVFIREIKSYAQGWGKNAGNTTQITKELLKYSKISLIHTMLHENFHIHLKKNKVEMNKDIEEKCADKFADDSVRIYYRNNLKKLIEIQESEKYIDNFHNWLETSVNTLKKAYSKNNNGRRMLYYVRQKYNFDMDFEIKHNRYTIPFEKKNINNAFFQALAIYAVDRDQVREVLENKDPRNYLKKITSKKQIDTIDELRTIVK